MNELFLKIINMSISASWLILAVLILRLVLKKAPKWVNVLLWGIVAVRLICPLSFESALSLIPSSETIPLDIEMAAKPTIDSGVPAINSVVNPVLSSFAPPQHVLTSANPLQIWIPILNIIWLIGVGALLLYTAVSYWRLCRKVDTAVRYKGNIFQSENVSSPFVLGIIKPRIYLPFNMNGQDLEHVVAHEQAHIRRKDHWWKPLGLLWSSFFVTLVAKKIVLINLCYRPCFIWGSITIITVWTNMIIINVCKFFYLLIECFLCCKLIQICAFILQGIEVTLHRCIVVRIPCFAHALCHISSLETREVTVPLSFFSTPRSPRRLITV